MPRMPDPLAHWVHDLDPFLIRFSGDFGIRWYGLAYLLGILAGWWMIKRWAQQERIPLRPYQAADFATYIGIGMVLGGRLGYCLLYEPRLFISFGDGLPWWGVLRITDGGMASHGGLAGFFAGCWLFSYRKGISFLVLTDIVAVLAPIGVFFGRMANFINGELWGKEAPGVRWAMHFPESINEIGGLEQVQRFQAFANRQGIDVDLLTYKASLVKGSPEWVAFYQVMTDPRHPSQLYAAGLEGLVVLIVSLLIYHRHKCPGLSTGVALGTYSIVRFIDEFWRQPDHGYELYFGWMSKGQLYSFPFLLAACLIGWFAWRKGARPELYVCQDDSASAVAESAATDDNHPSGTGKP